MRDVVQNHLLQVIALLAMDAPAGQDAQTMHAEKLRLFRAMRPLDPAQVVRGQFRGYRDEPGVAADSQVETFVALRLHIDTWRWAGVPFYIRAGKCLPITATEVIVDLKKPPLPIFDDAAAVAVELFPLPAEPEVLISAGVRVKAAGDEMRGEPVELVARHQSQGEKSPYQRLLGAALRGDASLFTRDEAVEAAWRVVDPVLGAGDAALVYEPGTWGPAEAANLFAGDDGWRDPVSREEPAVLNDARDRVCLLDVDNTLLDNDRFAADLGAHLERGFGVAQRDRYWAILRSDCATSSAIADYLAALQRFRVGPRRRPALLRCRRVHPRLPVRRPALSARARGRRPRARPRARRRVFPTATSSSSRARSFSARAVGCVRGHACSSTCTRSACSTRCSAAIRRDTT